MSDSVSCLLFYMMCLTYATYMILRYPFSPDQDVTEPDWEVFLRETANCIVSQQTPQR